MIWRICFAPERRVHNPGELNLQAMASC